MNSHWKLTKLAEVLTPTSRAEAVDPTKEYRLLGVRLDGRGPFLRETVMGSQSAATRLFKVRSGDFIYSRLFACRGAFGGIEPELDSCYVSGEFPTFRPVPGKIDTEFLRLWFRLPSTIERVEMDCTGSTPLTRNRFKENFFLDLEMPLPALAEQRRIMSRVESLVAKIDEARSLRQQAVQDEERLLICMAHREDLSTNEKLRSGWFETTVGSICRFTDESELVDGSRSYPNLGIFSYGRGVFQKPSIEGVATSAQTLRRVRAGQFIYSRLFAFEGAYAMVPSELDGYYVSGEYPTFTCDPTKACAEFLWSHFRSPNVWQTVAVGSKGLGNRRQRVQPDRVLDYRLWVPPMEWQRKIQSVQAKVGALKKLQDETTAELAALLPSILDKAFKGEL